MVSEGQIVKNLQKPKKVTNFVTNQNVFWSQTPDSPFFVEELHMLFQKHRPEFS